jgi:MFS transporter, DHA1 family, inner membrane transport protein
VKISFSRQEKILLFILAAIQFNHIVDFMILMPLGPQLMRLFSISTTQFSWLVSSYTFCAGISGFIASFIMDQFDRKRLLIFFFIGFCVGTLACALAPTYELLLLSRALTGMFGGVLNSVVLSIVSDVIPYEKRGTAMGVISTAFSLASVAGVPFALYLANLWGWHSSFLFLAGVSFLIFPMILLWIPKQSSHLGGPKARKPILDPLLHIFRTPGQLWALVFGGCLVLGQFMIIPFLSPSLVANAGLQESELPFIYLVGGTLTFITGPIVGRLSDQIGKHQVFKYGLISSLFVTLWITSLSVQSIYLTLTIVGLFFISVNARWVPALALISSVPSPEYRGSFMSFVGCVQQLMAALGAMMAGMIVTRSSDGLLHNYGWVGLVSVTFSFIAFLLSYLVIRDRKQPN